MDTPIVATYNTVTSVAGTNYLYPMNGNNTDVYTTADRRQIPCAVDGIIKNLRPPILITNLKM